MKKILIVMIFGLNSVFCIAQSKVYLEHKDMSVDSILISHLNRIYFIIDTSKTVEDLDGNIYHSVKIGTQVWMAENLRTTKYRNGDTIPNVTDGTEWVNLTTGAFCNYNNVNNGTTYGRLYNWYAVNDSRNIAPMGWHVPTYVEWTTLMTHLGGESGAGKLRSTSGWFANGNGTDDYGFSALPGGWRDDDNGTFSIFGNYGGWWSSTAVDATYAYRYLMHYSSTGAFSGSHAKVYGFSVRLIKD